MREFGDISGSANAIKKLGCTVNVVWIRSGQTHLLILPKQPTIVFAKAKCAFCQCRYNYKYAVTTVLLLSQIHWGDRKLCCDTENAASHFSSDKHFLQQTSRLEASNVVVWRQNCLLVVQRQNGSRAESTDSIKINLTTCSEQTFSRHDDCKTFWRASPGWPQNCTCWCEI